LSIHISFIQQYCRFFSVDAKCSLLDGRNFELLHLFEMTTELICYQADEVIIKKVLKEIAKGIDRYATKSNWIAPYTQNCDNFSFATNEIRDFFKYPELKEFSDSYVFLNEKVLGYKSHKPIETLLVEFNNAFAHFLSALRTINDDALKNKNIARAKAHLHRGALDAYKEAIKNKASVIKNNKHLVVKFNTLRTNEMRAIGKDDTATRKEYKDFALELY
jgi:hypothetical protein